MCRSWGDGIAGKRNDRVRAVECGGEWDYSQHGWCPER